LWSRDQVFERLRSILKQEFGLADEQIVPGAQLADDLGLDSVDAVALAVRIEEETQLALAEEELRSLQTLAQVVDLLHARLASARP
jgi:acyl carrier protein